ncbi:MAG: dienelactone hydrolase family protein [Limnothrix sp. RL_2_0]|nr:dienelactone hydrolase family protein [Limnothrix sp. RL_2_0]
MTLCDSQFVQIPNGELVIDAYFVQPVGVEQCPAVIVIQEIFGVNDHIRDITRRIAALGYVAIAPAIYQRIAPGFEAGYDPEDVKVGRAYKVQTKASELLSDLQATVDYLSALPQVSPTSVGCIGFCFGGHVAYLGATLPAVKVTASFYGAGIANWCPGEELAATVDLTAEIKGKIYAFFGEEDASIPAEQVAQIETALKSHHIDHQIFRYAGAGHGFFCDRRGSYHPEAALDAWQKVQTLLQTL